MHLAVGNRRQRTIRALMLPLLDREQAKSTMAPPGYISFGNFYRCSFHFKITVVPMDYFNQQLLG
jgi:hypothetical protein